MAQIDSFDMWGASLCWADEALPPAPATEGSPCSTVAAAPPELTAVREGGQMASVTVDVPARRAEAAMLSTQDILEHQASVDCDAFMRSPETGRSSSKASDRFHGEVAYRSAPVQTNSKFEEVTNVQQIPAETISSNLEEAFPVPEAQNDSTLPYEAQRAPDATLPYEAYQAQAADATLPYEAFLPEEVLPKAPEASAAPDVGDLTQIYEEPRCQDTLLYEVAPELPSFKDVLREELQTLPYEFVEDNGQMPAPSAADTLEYEVMEAPHVATVATPSRQGVHVRTSASSAHQEKARTSKKGARSEAPAAPAEQSKWLVPKRRRVTAEAAPVPQAPVEKAKVTGQWRTMAAPGRPGTRQLTLTEAWKGRKAPHDVEEVL